MKLFKNIFNKTRPIVKGDNTNHLMNYKFIAGLDCDEIPDSYGEFGRTPTNPIPVNGPKGEILYFQNIRTTDNQPLIFHRLTSTPTSGLDVEEAVDIFEITTPDGKFWDILYLHMYHPRNSNKLPDGYEFSEYHKVFSTIPHTFGITNLYQKFPDDFGKVLEEQYSSVAKIADVYAKITSGTNFIRPQEHFLKLVHVNSVGNFFNSLSDYISFQYPTNYFINLLRTNDQFGQVTALLCLEKLPSELLEKYLDNICDFAARIDDNATNELCIGLLEKVSSKAKEFYGIIIDFLENLNNPTMALSSLQMLVPTATFGKIAIPYLSRIANHELADKKLKDYCYNKIEELKFE